ncbi:MULTISPECIES: zinc metallopeptidase [unclassified Butyrivibrio]|uniref:zinc metallopeptidase n=1 Tax=unclassified Butyrivibrio TaxID=2639466 RepID=UPI0003B6B1A9|nr:MULTISPECIES: zinc metallopeptidase [unclassified Butyrivibrio]MDC7294231.1 zinc metallopeptidase [Butyrivibrio sp. DSM 10294]
MYYGYGRGYGYGMGFDPLYILVIIMAILCMVASARVSSVYKKYARIRSMSGLTGAQTAMEILRRNGITDVTVAHVSGNLTDHYDPKRRMVCLSDATYGSCSVAAVGVAAHECGHVLQHYTGYIPIRIRSAIVPAANIGSKAGIPIILLGFFLSFSPLVTIGIWVFSLAVIFQLVTLPVEFNASHRALVMLEQYGILGHEEITHSRKVLSAAAMTYVASAASAVVQLFRLVLIYGRRGND